MRLRSIVCITAFAAALVPAVCASAATSAPPKEVECGPVTVRGVTYLVYATGVRCPFARGWVPRLAVQRVRQAKDRFGQPLGQNVKGPTGYKCAANPFRTDYPLASLKEQVKKARARGLSQNDGNCGSLARSLVKFSWEIQFAA
jgi:hypothetical protein